MRKRPPRTALVMLRMSGRDRQRLEELVELERAEAERRGVTASLSSVVRALIRDAARKRGLEGSEPSGGEGERARDVSPARRWGPLAVQPAPSVSPEIVRELLRARTAERRGLAGELARALGVEPSQVSRFKAGKEAFPAAKLDALHRLLVETRKVSRRQKRQPSE